MVNVTYIAYMDPMCMYCWYLLAIDPVMYDIHVYMYILSTYLDMIDSNGISHGIS